MQKRKKNVIRTGIEALYLSPPEWMKNKRIGLLCNAASCDSRYRHASELIDQAFPGALRAIFSPQHGFFAEKQDNMIESDHFIDSKRGIPVYSLYGETRIPTPEMFEKIDVLIVDLQDAGARVYTFFTTMAYCMEQAAKMKIKVVIADRPNPIGGRQMEGNLLRPDCQSFVGRFPIPMRHGLTPGEFARYINTAHEIRCDLAVIPMSGWKRVMYYNDTGLAWIPPSPNLPTPSTAMVYPGQVLLEGTNLSEGRGTTQPFEIFGAPYLDTDAIIKAMGGRDLPGAFLRPVIFEPVSNKWASSTCHGFQIHVTDPGKYSPYETSIRLIASIYQRHHEDGFEWKQPPYEYEWDRNPFDLITGNRQIRESIEAGIPVDKLKENWKKELAGYRKEIESFLLYD